MLPYLHYLSPRYLLLYHACSRLDIDYCLSTCSCMHVLTTRFSMHVYDPDLSNMCAYLARHLALASPLAGESDSPGSLCLSLRVWSLWILPIADIRGAAVAWISSRPSRALSFQAPYMSLEFSFCKLVSAPCTVHTYTSLCILAFVPIGDVIFL